MIEIKMVEIEKVEREIGIEREIIRFHITKDN